MAATDRPSPVAFVVLATLMERPLHAYALHRLLQERGKTEVVPIPTRATLYPVLDRLARNGLVAVQAVERDQRRPERTVYCVTESGQEVVTTWLRAYLAAGSAQRSAFTVALSFAMLLTPDEVATALESRRTELESERAGLSDGLAAGHDLGLPELFQLDDRYRVAMLDADVSVVEDLIVRLRSGSLAWDRAWIEQIAAQMQRAMGADAAVPRDESARDAVTPSAAYTESERK